MNNNIGDLNKHIQDYLNLNDGESSKLIKEAKPLFEKEKVKSLTSKVALSMVAGVSFFILTGFVVLSWLPNYNYDKAVSSDIYPVDEYGLVELF